MIAPEYFNNHVAVEGEIIVKSVPNDAGFVLVWNPTTKKISRRTHTQLISDLNLVTSNQLGNYWQKYDNGSYRGIDDDSGANFSFLTNGGVTAKKINTGGLLTSDEYSDQQYIPANGIYSKGNIATLNYGSAIDWAIAYNWTQTQGATMNWVNANFVTINTAQDINARKSIGGGTGNEYTGAALEIRGNGSTIFPSISFHQPGAFAGAMSYRGDDYGYYFMSANADAFRWLNALGYRKAGSSDDYVLTGAGGHMPVSSFASGNYISYQDNREINPSLMEPRKLGYGFTTWDNNNDNAPYADYLHFGGYVDVSGGSQNLIVFRKNGFGIRQWQGEHQSINNYSDYVDYWHTGSLPNPVDQSQLSGYVSKSGDTMTGNLNMGSSIITTNTSNSNEWHTAYNNGLVFRNRIFQSNVDANNLGDDRSAIISIETANGSGNTNFPNNSTYGVFMKMTSGAFTSEFFHQNGGELWHRNWYLGGAGPSTYPFRKIYDNINLPNPVDQSQLSNYVTIHTPQTIIADKTFAPTSNVNFYGNDGSVVKVLRKSSGTAEVVAGHEYCFYDTRWKVGNKRGGGANSLGFTFNVSGNDGATYDEIVLIQADGNILTSNFGASSDWNAKVSQSQLSGYVNKSGDTMTGTLNALTISAQNGADKLIYDNIENFGSTLKINANASLGIQLQSNNNTKVLIDEGGSAFYGNVYISGTLDLKSGLILSDSNSPQIWSIYQTTTGINFYVTGGNTQGNVINFSQEGYIQASGFVKEGSSNDYLLLGGGSHKNVSDFATSTDLSNYVTINTPQTIIGSKTYAPTSDVKFLGTDANHINVFRSASVYEIVSGHEYTHYNTSWKVGNKRGGDTDSIGYSFQFSSDGGATYADESVLIQADGNILTSNFGSANLWNAKVSQSQLNNYLPLSGGTLTGSLNINSNSEIGRWKGADNNTNYLIWRNYGDTKDIAYIGADGNSAVAGGVGDGFAIVAPSGSLQLLASSVVTIQGHIPWTAGNLDPNTYLSKSGGTLTSGGRIDAQGTITIQQADTFNATGLFWETMANSDNMAGIGALTTGDTLHGVYMGWGQFPWQPQHSLSVSIDYIKYKGFDVWHAGNFNPNDYATSTFVINSLANKVNSETNAFALGFVGGTAVTPYVKHSNGTEVNIASQNWVNENKFVRANIPFDNSLGRNIFLSDNYFGGETGLYDKNNDHIIAGWFNNLYYYGADVNGGSNSSGIFMDYNTGHHGYRSTPNPNYFHYFNGNMQVNDNVTAQGFIKNNSSDDYFLMGGGGQLTKYSKEDAFVNSGRDFADGTLITTNIDYSHSEGDSFLLEIKGNMYGGGIPMDTKVQGYIYADTIINQSGYSTYADLTTIIAMNINGNLCFWFPRLWYWQGFSVKVIATGGGGITTVNRVISIDNSAEPVGTKQVKIAVYTLSTQSWVNNQGFLTSANLNGYVTQSALNTQLGSYATLNGVQTFNNTNTFNQSPVIPNGTLGNHAVNLNQLLDVAPPYHWNYVGQPAITNRRVLREMTWNNYGNGHTIFDISSGTTPWGASKSNVDAEQKWTPSYPTLVGGNGSETYGVRVDSARNADNLGGISAGNYATQTWVNTNFIPTSHPVHNITQANINSWNAGTGGGSSHTHFNLSYLNNIDQYLGTGQAPQFSSVRLMNSLGYGLLALGEDFIGGEVGLVDLSNDRFYAGRINEYLKYGSSVNGFEGLNIHFDAKLLGIGREIGNDEDKVQLAGDLSVDTVDFDHNSRQLVLNPLYNADGDVRRSRNAHIYIVTRNPVRLPDKPILGQRIEIFNDSDSDIEVTHGNVGTMFKVPAFCKITGIAANKGFRFDAEPIRTKQYDI
ncbi:hypothetical protein [Chryseobacterium sp. 18068]|uniref:hypothetical protein n=1 Tax=Chryseobacterium sp. 18068 TaxID=2681414 RepID=UPI0013599185|nr:hypothetical protein [Chryseobacterium sp. 18068]